MPGRSSRDGSQRATIHLIDERRLCCHSVRHGNDPDTRQPGAGRRRAVGTLGLPRPAPRPVALRAACPLGPADRLVAAAVAMLVVGGAGCDGRRKAGACLRRGAAFAVAPRPVPRRRHGHAGRRLHLQRHRRRGHRRRRRAHAFPPAALGPGEPQAGLDVPARCRRWSGWSCFSSSTASRSSLGVASLAVVAIYPFTKRFTDWPQLVLGLAFSWGALDGLGSAFRQPVGCRRRCSISARSCG